VTTCQYPGKSNYYFDPLSSVLYNKGLGIFGASNATNPSTSQSQSTSVASSYGPTLEEAMGIKLMQQAMQGAPQPKNAAQRFADFLGGVGKNLGVLVDPLSTPGY
jgi:hypothetical protein